MVLEGRRRMAQNPEKIASDPFFSFAMKINLKVRSLRESIRLHFGAEISTLLWTLLFSKNRADYFLPL